jgi:hypothetical protein
MVQFDKEFGKCLFDPRVVDMFVEYPSLGEFQGIDARVDNRLMKYISCVYDYKSPIVIHNRDSKVRKRVGAQYAGYDESKEDVETLYGLKEDYLLLAVDIFLKNFIHNRTWNLIVCNESLFYEYSKRILEPVGKDEKKGDKDVISAMLSKTTLSENMASICDRLDIDYKKLYGEDIDRMSNFATSPYSIAYERSKLKNN